MKEDKHSTTTHPHTHSINSHPQKNPPLLPIVLFHLKSLFSSPRHLRRPAIAIVTAQETLSQDISKLLQDINLSAPLIFIALFYLTKFRYECVTGVQVSCDEQYELFVVSLIVACKMHDDDRYTNLVWSQVCGIPLEALNGSERVFLDVLEWKVHVTKEVYDEMTRDIK